MPKTTAKVEHRDYVPDDWIAIEFCNVDFYGFRAKEMEEKWHDIERKVNAKYDSLYEENETKIQSLYNQANAIRKQVKASKPFYRFWYNKQEKEMLSKANKLLYQAYELEEENEKIRENEDEDKVYECHREIEKILKQHGFVLTSTSSKGKGCVTKIEIWTLEE